MSQWASKNEESLNPIMKEWYSKIAHTVHLLVSANNFHYHLHAGEDKTCVSCLAIGDKHSIVIIPADSF